MMCDSAWTVSVPFRGLIFPNPVPGESTKLPQKNSFRPLSGSYLSKSDLTALLYSSYWFPSPFGVLSFQIGNPVFFHFFWQRVSVPFRGLIFPNGCEVEDLNKLFEGFPSPFGVLSFQMKDGYSKPVGL